MMNTGMLIRTTVTPKYSNLSNPFQDSSRNAPVPLLRRMSDLRPPKPNSGCCVEHTAESDTADGEHDHEDLRIELQMFFLVRYWLIERTATTIERGAF